MFRLPNLIFAELHEDPATAQIINRILPNLARLGYGVFLDEVPNKLTRKKFLELLKAEEAEYAKLVENIGLWNAKYSHVRINDKRISIKMDITQLDTLSELEKGNLLVTITAFWIANQGPKFLFEPNLLGSLTMIENNPQLASALLGIHVQSVRGLICRHQSRIEWIKLLETNLDKENIGYHTIDEALGLFVSSSGLIKQAMKASRDDAMFHAYQTTSMPALGRIGLLHAEGLQTRAIDTFGNKEKADARFCFFHLYSRPKMNLDDIDVLPDGLALVKDREEDARLGGQKLPLGITAIDITGLNDQAILDIIVRKIKQKQDNFAALAPSIKTQMASEYDNYIVSRSQEKTEKKSEFNSLFAKTGKMSATTKINAARKMITLLIGNDAERCKVSFLPEEIQALRQKRLGGITDKLALFKILPEEFVTPKMDVAGLRK